MEQRRISWKTSGFVAGCLVVLMLGVLVSREGEALEARRAFDPAPAPTLTNPCSMQMSVGSVFYYTWNLYTYSEGYGRGFKIRPGGGELTDLIEDHLAVSDGPYMAVGAGNVNWGLRAILQALMMDSPEAQCDFEILAPL